MNKTLNYLLTFCLCMSMLMGSTVTAAAAGQTLTLEGYLHLPSGGKSAMDLSIKNMPSGSTAVQVDFLADKALHIEDITFPYGAANNCYSYYKVTDADGRSKVSLYLVSPKQNTLPAGLPVAKIIVAAADASLLKQITIDQIKILDGELEENVYGGKLVIDAENAGGDGGSSGSNGGSGGANDTMPKEPAAAVPKVSVSGPRDMTTVSVEVSATADSAGIAKAAISRELLAQAADKAISQGNKTARKEVQLQMLFPDKPDQRVSGLHITFSKAGMSYLSEKQIDSLSIRSALVSFTMDAEAVEAILAQAEGDITMRAEVTAGSKPVLALTAASQKGRITDLSTGSIRVSLPYAKAKGELDSNLVISALAGKDETAGILANSSYDGRNKALTFFADHSSSYAVNYKKSTVTSDVKSHKSKEAIEFMRVRELLINKSRKKTVPGQSITREEVAAALGKISAVDVKDYKIASFKDVPKSNANFPYIAWADKAGIIKGTSKTRFQPASAVTRQELASILARYAAYEKYDLPKASKKVVFADKGKIAKSNASAVSGLQMAGIMKGTSAKKFEPTKKVTRADFSETLKSYVESALHIGE